VLERNLSNKSQAYSAFEVHPGEKCALIIAVLAACALLIVGPSLLPVALSSTGPHGVHVSFGANSAGVQISASANGNLVINEKLTTGSKIGSVTLTITPLMLNGGKYSNIQTTTVKSTTGSLMNGVAVTMYENAGRSGGYYHGVTGPTKYPAGEAIEHDTYPGAGSYTEWSSVTLNGQTVLSVKITVIVP
jgi:hypothetical protein